MSKYWITTHYPHPMECRNRPSILNVFHKEEPNDQQQTISVGDVVYFRETTTQQKRKVEYIEGKTRRFYETRVGTGGVFARAKIVETWRRRSNEAVVDYGDVDEFRWVLPCAEHEFCKDIELEDLREILNRTHKDTCIWCRFWEIPQEMMVARLDAAFVSCKRLVARVTAVDNILRFDLDLLGKYDPKRTISVRRNGDDRWEIGFGALSGHYAKVTNWKCNTKDVSALILQAVTTSTIKFDQEDVVVPENFAALYISEFAAAFQVQL